MNLLLRSLQLDMEFLGLDVSLEKKIEFLWEKYMTIIKHIFLPVRVGKSSADLFDKKYFYDDKYGTAVLQSTYTDNAFLAHFIQPKSIVVDIGANIGQFRFFSEDFLRAKTVYSFEPIKETFEILEKNFPKNSFNFAVSTKKKLQFYLFPLSVWASAISQENAARKEIVSGVCLDDISQVRKEKTIDLLKIDVEGAEEAVLLACAKTLRKSRYILIEASIDRSATGDMFSLMATLKKLVPQTRLIRVGRSYNSLTYTTGAVDLLFKNNI